MLMRMENSKFSALLMGTQNSADAFENNFTMPQS
jgi:hypothetical protein